MLLLLLLLPAGSLCNGTSVDSTAPLSLNLVPDFLESLQ
jgi:hypothetical protein